MKKKRYKIDVQVGQQEVYSVVVKAASATQAVRQVEATIGVFVEAV